MKKMIFAVVGLFVILSTNLLKAPQRAETVISIQPTDFTEAQKAQISQLCKEGNDLQIKAMSKLFRVDERNKIKDTCCQCMITSCIAGLVVGTAYYFEQKSK